MRALSTRDESDDAALALFRPNTLGHTENCAICGRRLRDRDIVWYGLGREVCPECYAANRDVLDAVRSHRPAWRPERYDHAQSDYSQHDHR